MYICMQVYTRTAMSVSSLRKASSPGRLGFEDRNGSMEDSSYPLVICYNVMERSTMSNGKIHHFIPFLCPFSIAMLNYQRLMT